MVEQYKRSLLLHNHGLGINNNIGHAYLTALLQLTNEITNKKKIVKLRRKQLKYSELTEKWAQIFWTSTLACAGCDLSQET